MVKPLVAEQAYHFESPPTKVFRALVDPKVLVRWFLSDATLVPERGGAFEFDWIGGYHMESKVTRYSAGREVGLLWVDRLPGGKIAKTQVRFRVRKKGRGAILALRHSGFTDPEHFAECSSRWAYYLTNLKSVLDHRTDLRSKWDW